MNYSTKLFSLLIISAIASIGLISAQAPAPGLVVQAANQPSAPAPVKAVVAPDNSNLLTALRSLRDLKTANDETLKKQQAAIEQLDDLQKAAQQIKIFSHRTGG
jgi:hypothetical protein